MKGRVGLINEWICIVPRISYVARASVEVLCSLASCRFRFFGLSSLCWPLLCIYALFGTAVTRSARYPIQPQRDCAILDRTVIPVRSTVVPTILDLSVTKSSKSV